MRRNSTKIVALLLTLCFFLTSCGQAASNGSSPNGTDTPGGSTGGGGGGGAGPTILFVLTGSLGDSGVGDATYAVLKNAAEKMNGNVVAFECNYDASLYESSVIDACQSGEYDLIVAGYYNLQEAVMLGAEQYPNQKFLCFDVAFDYSDGKYPNIVSYQARQNECGFLSGVVAGILTTSGVEGTNPDKTVGFVGAAENTAIQDFLVGYIEGVNFIDSQIEVLYAFVGDWANTAKAKELGYAQIQQGADVSYSVCGNAGLGNAEAAAEAGHWNLNVDQDWATATAESNPELSKVILTSSVKAYTTIIESAMEEYVAGTLQYGQHHLVGWADGAITMFENDTYKRIFTPEMKSAYDAVCDDLAAGKIHVGTAIGATQAEIEAYKAKAKPF